MKTKIWIICLLSISVLSTSCTKIMLYSYGVRNPKVENKKSILDYLESNKLSTENNYCLKDTSSLNKFYLSKIGTPEIHFYDNNGYLMLYRDDKKCNGQNDSLISFLNPKNVIKIDSTNNLSDYLLQLKTLEGQEINLNEFKSYDYYLVVYWAKWIGKTNKTKIEDWENSLKQKNNLKIKTIKVSTDYMNFWELDKKDMAKIYSPKTKTQNKKE